MDRRILFILFLILLVGTFLRLRSLDEDLLWQDEAEVAIYARQIVSGGFPNEYYRGIQVYVSPLIPEKVDSVMYEYKQRDFRDGLAVYHPPADAYLTALSFFLLGTSTFAARLPFALLGIASLFLIYQLGKFLYNTRIGLFACILQATSVLLILFERQSRYYSLSVFGFLAMLYFSLKAFRTGTMLYYAASSLSFVLLFYTQPIIAIIAMTSLVFYNIYIGKYKILFSKKYILSLATSLSLLTPYLIIIRPWEISGSYLGSFEISKLLILPFFINEVIYNVGSMALLISAIFIFNRSNSSDKFIILSWLTYIIITLLLTPYFSFYPRIFIQMLPTFYIAIAVMVDFIYIRLKRLKLNHKLVIGITLITILSLSLLPHLFSLRPKFDIPLSDFLKGEKIRGIGEYIKTSSAWTYYVVSLLEKENTSDEWVFTTYQNAPLLFYTDYRVQLIWPVKKEFLETLKGRFWIVVDPESGNHCKWFNFYIGDVESICKNTNFQEVVKKCKEYQLYNNLTIYRCN